MRRNSGLLTASAAASALLVHAAHPPSAAAYCRTSSCAEGTGSLCEPAQPSDCGIPIYWPSHCVGYSVQEDASREVPYGLAATLVDQAFSTWMSASCPGGGHPSVRVDDMGPVACDQHEYNRGKGNANIIMFRDDAWPHGGASATLALTTVSYGVDSGRIYDADMELNTAQVDFTTSDANVGFDLLSVLTHETGHFLGLAHSPVKDATMVTDYLEGTTGLRDLSPDDVNAICAVFPPGEAVPDSCEPSFTKGLASACGSDQEDEDGAGACCAVAPGEKDSGGGGRAALASFIAAAVLSARRRDRSVCGRREEKDRARDPLG